MLGARVTRAEFAADIWRERVSARVLSLEGIHLTSSRELCSHKIKYMAFNKSCRPGDGL